MFKTFKSSLYSSAVDDYFAWGFSLDQKCHLKQKKRRLSLMCKNRSSRRPSETTLEFLICCYLPSLRPFMIGSIKMVHHLCAPKGITSPGVSCSRLEFGV